ncbi:MAG: 16S rRNA (cytosine(1402)-N(4))-methyltransferase RsmH [Bacteroidota bacterium]
MTSNSYHNPVLLHAATSGLNLQPGGIYVDVTFGGGGHSREILSHLTTGKLFAFDQDAEAAANVPQNEKFVFIPANFRNITNSLRTYGVTSVNGILADLGVSSHQFDAAHRGFSIRFEAKLDMRMNHSQSLSAFDVINRYEPHDLKRIFRMYGEVENAGRLVNEIDSARKNSSVETTAQLISIAEKTAPRNKVKQYLAQVFQALRIEVNDEMGALKELLKQSTQLLKPGGRLSVISYHSLEDRLVKNWMKAGNDEGEVKKDFYGNPLKPFTEITRKPLIPDAAEIEQNPRARSAKLRIAERTNEPV